MSFLNKDTHKAPKGLKGTRFPSCTSEVTEGLVPPLESPHLSFIAVPTSRTVSELTGAITSGLSHSEHPIGTPQVTSGEGGSITLPYF